MSETVCVLYAEDDPDIRAVAELALEDEGFDLLMCQSGLEAVERAPHVKPDLLLLDVMMPGLDGPSTLKRLRTFPHLATTPVVFMTAKVQANEMSEYEALGALGVINKPFDPMALPMQLRKLLSQSR